MCSKEIDMFSEGKRLLRPKFCDDSRQKIGKFATRNRLNILNDLMFDWKDGLFF